MKTARRRFVAIVSSFLTLGLLGAFGRALAVTFLAVGAGDPSSDGAMLWTRASTAHYTLLDNHELGNH